MNDADLDIPAFLDRSKWTQEQHWANDDMWDVRMEEGRKMRQKEAAIQLLEKNIRTTERQMNQAYGMMSRYFEGTTSYKMTLSRAESYKKRLAILQDELRNAKASQLR